MDGEREQQGSKRITLLHALFRKKRFKLTEMKVRRRAVAPIHPWQQLRKTLTDCIQDRLSADAVKCIGKVQLQENAVWSGSLAG